MMEISSVGEVLERAAAQWGRRTALVFRHRRVSYTALQRATGALIARLKNLGLEPGHRVAIHMENRPEYVQAYFAVPAAGGTLVPLNTFLASAESHEQLQDCGARFLIVSPASLEKIAPALKGLRELREILVIGDPGAARTAPLHLNVTCIPEFDRGEVAGEGRAPFARVPSSRDDIAVIIYTSGTTGKSKGVMLTHRNLLCNAESCIEAVGVTERDRILLFLPMFHSFTEMVGILAPIMAGMTIIICERVDRAEIRRAIIRHRPTIFPGVPAVFAAMSQVRVGRMARWLNPVRLYISGGAPLSLDTLRAFEERHGRPLCEGYGLSEASPVVAINSPAGPRKAGSIGLPLPGVEVMIADGEGRSLAPGETGELLVRGDSVMKGYYGRPEETARSLRDGWLHTGDLARRDEEGCLFIMGRAKEMLICRGMNVYPREIENVLEEHPLVKEAAVIGVPDRSRGEVPHAFIVLRSGQGPTESELKRVCLEKLARYKVPRSFHFVTELPRNPAGKVSKEELKQQALLIPPAEERLGARFDRARQAER